MPELPEVETIRLQLRGKIVGKKLEGKKIIDLRRRAKILIFDFVDGSSMLIHLKLTGQLIFNGKILPYTRKVFHFDDGTKLVFNDVRKFGWWKKVKNSKPIEDSFGPESLDISLASLKDIFKKKPNSKIKLLLMDQKAIAGIGNIYSDEILFASRVHPLRLVKTLKEEEIKRIHQNIKKILKKAIKRQGSSVEHYVDARGKKGSYAKEHKVYQKEGQKCFSCGSIIKRIKLSGRSVRFCPVCQPIQ